MAQLTIVKLLWCGQGMTTLVECYDDGVEKLKADCLVLVDCGGNVEWGGGAIDYVAKKVLATDNKHLDAVIISHQDQDHVILLKGLGEKLKGQATVGRIFLGGLSWEESNKKTVRQFIKDVGYSGDTVQFNAPETSHYMDVDDVADLEWWVQHGDMHIRVLVSGLAATGRPDIVKNASSAMVAVDNGTWSVVLPGDATYQTMNRVNKIKNIGKLLPTVAGLEIPHHGALRTAVEEYVANKEPSHFNFDIITKFAQVTSPRHVGASAGPWNTHHHPIEEVLAVFDSKVTLSNEHTYVSYIFQRPNGIAHEGWTEFYEVVVSEWCTVHAIGETAKLSKSKNKAVKEGQNKGTFLHGDIIMKLGGAVELPIEEMVTFRPTGTLTLGVEDEPLTYAPAP